MPFLKTGAFYATFFRHLLQGIADIIALGITLSSTARITFREVVTAKENFYGRNRL